MSEAEYKETLAQINHAIETSKASIAGSTLPTESTWWSTTNAMTISAAVLIFGFLICVISAYLVRNERSPEAILRIMGTLLIIIAAIFLVVAGYSDKQIAPVMGLLGTIAGYLLGKNTSESKA